tara:strand:+ start:4313 stop:5410 length:1098 start_codon:yes stop_codon:yes gene_type:complete
MAEQEATTKLTEEAVEAVEQEVKEEKKEEFNPSSFLSDDIEPITEETKEESTTKVEASKEETKEEINEEESSDDIFNWESIEVPEEKEEEKVEDNWDLDEEEKKELEEEPKQEVKEEDWDKEETPVEAKKEEPTQDWAKISKELGVEIKSIDDIVEAYKNKPTETVEIDEKSKSVVGKLSNYLKLEDFDLVLADLKAQGMEEEKAQELTERLEDSGLLARDALKIRRDLKTAVAKATKEGKQKKEQELAQSQKAMEENRNLLQKHLKDTEMIYGVKPSTSDKKKLYRYIVSGKFYNDAFGKHDNVVNAAFLYLNANKILKIAESSGFESGKSKIVDSITNVDLQGKNRADFKVKSSGFDAKAFMK